MAKYQNPLKLIIESKDFGSNVLKPVVTTSAIKDGPKDYFLEGIFIQANVKNRNGRNYPKPLMERCVQKYVAERMNPQVGLRSFGELGHPDGVEINLDKVSHYVVSLDWDKDDVVGKAKVLVKNPCGRIIQTFIDDDLTIGVSTRGLGSLSKNISKDGSKQVESYEMIAIDAVADPSAPKGFVDGIMENKEYIIGDNGLITECYNGLERNLSSLPIKSDAKQKVMLDALEKFLKEIKNI